MRYVEPTFAAEEPKEILRVPLASWNLYADEIRRLRDALELIYLGDPNPQRLAAMVLRRDEWA